MSEVAGRLRNKGETVLSEIQYLLHSKFTAHLEKENAINIYSELRFSRLVVDGRPCCQTESFEECLCLSIEYVVVMSLGDRRYTLSVAS